MWRDGLRVVPWTTKGEARVTLLRFVGRTIFLNREFGKKSFQLDRRRIVFVFEIFPKKMQNFSFKVEELRSQISLKERVVKKEWKIETKG